VAKKKNKKIRLAFDKKANKNSNSMQINFILAEQPYIIVVRTPRRRRCGSFFPPYIRVLHYYYYIVAQPSGLEYECANLISFPFFFFFFYIVPERKRKKTSTTIYVRGTN